MRKINCALHGKPYFLFPDVLKIWSFQKNCAEIWSFLYYRERWFFFLPKIWSYTLAGKWKMIFLKKYTETWYFLQAFWKDDLSKKGRYLERWYFFPENMIFFSWAGSERRSFPGNTWKHDVSPSEEKQETWYVGSKLGFCLNLCGRRYCTMNNLQYIVPFSPHDESCLEVWRLLVHWGIPKM